VLLVATEGVTDPDSYRAAVSPRDREPCADQQE